MSENCAHGKFSLSALLTQLGQNRSGTLVDPG
jgi:hypothetical protein